MCCYSIARYTHTHTHAQIQSYDKYAHIYHVNTHLPAALYALSPSNRINPKFTTYNLFRMFVPSPVNFTHTFLSMKNLASDGVSLTYEGEI